MLRKIFFLLRHVIDLSTQDIHGFNLLDPEQRRFICEHILTLSASRCTDVCTPFPTAEGRGSLRGC